MWESILLLLFYLLGGLLCLAVAGWVVITGQFVDVDGLFLSLVCLTLAAVFLLAFGLAWRKGEFADVMAKLRAKKAEPQAEPESAQVAPSKTAQGTPS